MQPAMPCPVDQSCLPLCVPMNCRPPGSSVLGISQARMLEQLAISCSRGSSLPGNRTRASCVSCIGRRVLYHQCHLGSPFSNVNRCAFFSSRPTPRTSTAVALSPGDAVTQNSPQKMSPLTKVSKDRIFNFFSYAR